MWWALSRSLEDVKNTFIMFIPNVVSNRVLSHLANQTVILALATAGVGEGGGEQEEEVEEDEFLRRTPDPLGRLSGENK